MAIQSVEGPTDTRRRDRTRLTARLAIVLCLAVMALGPVLRVHHGHLVMFDAKSYRMTHALMRTGAQAKPPARKEP